MSLSSTLTTIYPSVQLPKFPNLMNGEYRQSSLRCIGSTSSSATIQFEILIPPLTSFVFKRSRFKHPPVPQGRLHLPPSLTSRQKISHWRDQYSNCSPEQSNSGNVFFNLSRLKWLQIWQRTGSAGTAAFTRRRPFQRPSSPPCIIWRIMSTFLKIPT